MALKLRTTIVAASLALGAAAAQATVLDFEGLPTNPNASTVFTSNYGGLQFGNNLLATNPWIYDDYNDGAFFYAKSGKNYAANDCLMYYQTDANGNCINATNVQSAGVTTVSDFVLNGAWFIGDPRDSIFFDLYNNGVKVATSAGVAMTGKGYQFVASGYAGLVDEFRVNGLQGY